MIDFRITFQADELLYRDYGKMGLSDFRNHVQKIATTITNENGITSSTKFKHSVLPRKRTNHYAFGFFILSVSFSNSHILFHQNQPNLSKVMLF